MSDSIVDVATCSLETNTTVNPYSCPVYHSLVGRGYFMDESIASRNTWMVCVHFTSEPRVARRSSIWSRHPGQPVATTSAPLFSIAFALYSPIFMERS